MNQELKKPSFKILFVDDEEKARKYFEKGLKNYFSILTAANISQAQDIIEEYSNEIAIVITDQRMPGGNGVKLLTYLRENHPQIVRLLTTAYSDLSDAIDSVNKGEIFRYIQKPWNYDLLRTELSQAMEFFEIRQEREMLLKEKIMVKKKITKIDRLKLLINISKTFNFIKFTSNSIENFVKTLSNRKPPELENKENWQSFELANEDLLEILLSVDVIDKIQNKISANEKYDFDLTLDGDKLKNLIAKELGNEFNINISQEIKNIKINNYSFRSAIGNISTFSKNKEIQIKQLEDGSGIQISFDLDDKTLDQNNILNMPAGKLKSNLCINLLTSYLFVGHNGGNIEINDNSSINLNISYNIDQAELEDDFSEDTLDNMLLALILE